MKIVALVLLLLVGCGGGDPEEEEPKQAPIPDVCEVQPRPVSCL